MPPRAKKAAAAAPVQSPRVTRSKRKTADEMMDAPKDTPVKKAKVEEVEDPKPASKKAAKPASKKETVKETPKKETAEEPKETPAKTEAKETPAKATPVKKPASKKETPAKATPKATPAKEKPASKKETPAKAEKPASKKEAAKPASKAEKPESKKEEPKSIMKKPASKKAAKEPTPEPEAEAESDDESFIGAPSDSDGADSSDDESDAEDVAVKAAAARTEVSKLPHARDDASVAARLKRASKKDAPRATVFLGRIPHGFYEEQMKEYFGQFGDVTRLRLARNPKTGASRHYAYIEFSSEPVAEIVADTMHNYLLMGHLLQCAVVPKDQVHPELWVGANKKFRKVPRARLEKVRNDKARTKEQQSKANAKVLARQDERRAKIKAAGIAYEFEGH
ncbi:hypothetical protein CcaverHIS002_0704620 [Cutaneotrichosporon cavernicola]|uniref:RRM domain-containing protein n=1 Tax=Cutaneotrichosporon cavernicola TaxID=279322 RepID=A0AA48QYP0_9TREE|nr:uncharacterized protein CcaverHIS019_0704700 [Cutaneotrichosporon cavernicola]BEI87116.1 hypothetical protein CcaverHIS002_0704620 [Cutaneotrichosporon cavernicola]BEI94889.1 hypothetical protein CcaverHIS019_0704700 [Cutaneotrichosporon cavernicola]BEJ02663.1 hypothetical protein CcaverHIS631_0704580 [Cutaneotrichosporon cavernicola]BEJ10419.1 hypothetical protein CcaverHIS641_0704540 [Cutaneotrichosporon cavernicola]